MYNNDDEEDLVEIWSTLQAPDTAPSPSRAEKSLGTLTQKFIQMLTSCDNGELDLNLAADRLQVRQKRRIYDITNVLEGVGLIKKTSKNSVQWLGGDMLAFSGSTTSAASRPAVNRMFDLRHELDELKQEELNLDQHLHSMRQSLKNVTEATCNRRLAYLKFEDFESQFSGKTVIPIQAPQGTELEVYPVTPDDLSTRRVHLNSVAGCINAYVLNSIDKSLLPVEASDSRAENVDQAASNDGMEMFVENNPTCGANSDAIIVDEDSRMSVNGCSSAGGEVKSVKRPLPAVEKYNQQKSVKRRKQNDSPAMPKRQTPAVTDASPRPGIYLEQGESSSMLRLSPPPAYDDFLFSLGGEECVEDLYNLKDLFKPT